MREYSISIIFYWRIIDLQWCVSFRCIAKVISCIYTYIHSFWGFPESSVGKESTCNAGDPSLIPESGRSTGEGIGYPLQYSWAFLMAQLVNNLPSIRETLVWSLAWEDPLEEGKATHCSVLAWRIPWIVCSPWGHKELDTTERLSLSLPFILCFRSLPI